MKKTLLSLLLVFTISIGYTANDYTVLICVSKTATKYHSHYCKGLKKCTHEVNRITIQQAKSLGYKPCGYCYKK